MASGSWSRQAVQSLSTLFYLTLAFSVLLVHSVSLFPSAASDTFPECGFSCTTFDQAETGCVPPSAPVTDLATYVSCFCQSSLLTNFHTSANGTCDSSCTQEADRELLQKWYSNYCASGGSSSSNSSETVSSSKTTSNSTVASASKDSTSANSAPQTWWTTHYKWIIMVIVLVVGFGLITVIGVWLKRRHDAKYPNLYHAAATGGSNSSLFANRNHDSPPPGPAPGAVAARTQESVNNVSIASSSRTAVVPPNARPARTPSRLQKIPPGPGEDDIETQQAPAR